MIQRFYFDTSVFGGIYDSMPEELTITFLSTYIFDKIMNKKNWGTRFTTA